SQRTRKCPAPRRGSRMKLAGFRIRSESWPAAWYVDEPSKDQVGNDSSVTRSFPGKATILVLERSRWVGVAPSSQIYSACRTVVIAVSSFFSRLSDRCIVPPAIRPGPVVAGAWVRLIGLRYRRNHRDPRWSWGMV